MLRSLSGGIGLSELYKGVTDGIVSVNGKPLTETVNGFLLTAALSHETETVNEIRVAVIVVIRWFGSKNDGQNNNNRMYFYIYKRQIVIS